MRRPFGRLTLGGLLALILAVSVAPPVAAQSPDGEVTTLEEIVVTARRAGAPVWRVADQDTTLVVVGAIRGVPEQDGWRPEALTRAVALADRVIFPQEARFSPADFVRLIFRGGDLVYLPNAASLTDYLTPADFARLRALEDPADLPRNWQRFRPWLLSSSLTRHAGLERRRTQGLSELVSDEARRARIPTTEVAVYRGADLIDALLASPPEGQVACLLAALDAAEHDPALADERVRAWLRADVPAVMASPLQIATDECSGLGRVLNLGDDLRADWSRAFAAALAQPGQVVAVVQLRVLAEPGGLLDRFVQQGLEVDGPTWREDLAVSAP